MADDEKPLIKDEISRRMERGIKRFLNTPPQPHGENPHTPPDPRPKQRSAPEGRASGRKTGR